MIKTLPKKSEKPIPSAPKSERQKYSRRVQAFILRRVLAGKTTSAEDVHPVHPVPDGIHPNVMGDIFAGLMIEGLIEPVDFIRSNRPCRHKGMLRVWKVLDRKKARAYLTALEKSGDGAQDAVEGINER